MLEPCAVVSRSSSHSRWFVERIFLAIIQYMQLPYITLIGVVAVVLVVKVYVKCSFHTCALGQTSADDCTFLWFASFSLAWQQLIHKIGNCVCPAAYFPNLYVMWTSLNSHCHTHTVILYLQYYTHTVILTILNSYYHTPTYLTVL